MEISQLQVREIEMLSSKDIFPTMATLLLLLLCTLQLTSTSLVPNKFMNTEKGEKTDLVTGMYYSLYNLGRNETDRGGLVSFYVNQDARRDDNDYELTYKTLVLDKGHHVHPGGKDYDSTLFSFKAYKDNLYQLYSKKLKGVVSYKQSKTGQYKLVVYGARMDVNLNILRKGSDFSSTLFAIRRLKNGNYQIVSNDINATVTYNPDGNRLHPFPQELVMIHPDLKTGKKSDKGGVGEHASEFQFVIGHVYEISGLPSINVLNGMVRKDVDNNGKHSKIDVIFETVNLGVEKVKHSVSHSETRMMTKVKLNEYEKDYKVSMSATLEGNLAVISPSKQAPANGKIGAGASVEVGGLLPGYEFFSNSSSKEEEEGDVITFNIELELDPDVLGRVVLTKNTMVNQTNLSGKNRIIVTGDRLNVDGSYTTDVDLDSDAIFIISKTWKFHENTLVRDSDDGNVYSFYELDVEIEYFVTCDINLYQIPLGI